MTADNVIYRRTELYEQIWAEPVRTVAPAYRISDVWLDKRKLFVPRPRPTTLYKARVTDHSFPPSPCQKR